MSRPVPSSRAETYSSADEAFNQAANLAPEESRIWLDWSLVYYSQGDYEQAFDLVYNGIADNPTESLLHYRCAVYLICQGKFQEAFSYLENALILNFDAHTLLFDFFEDIESQKVLYKIIDQYRPETPNEL